MAFVLIADAVLAVMLIGGGFLLYEHIHHLDQFGFPIVQHHLHHHH